MMASVLLLSAAFAGPHTALVGVQGPAVSADLLGGNVERCFRRARICLVSFPGAPPLEALRSLPGVRYAEADRLMVPLLRPAVEGTTDCPDLWEMDAIDISAAWDLAGNRGEAAPVVAIQDSGFRLSHVDLEGQVAGQYDYGNGDTNPEVERLSDVPGHGTFIAGLLVARDDNDVGRVGVLPQGRVNLQKIADDDGALYYSYAVAAMADLADADLGVRVLSYSIASSSNDGAFEDAVAALEDAGILLVTAAANCDVADCADGDNDAHPVYPGNLPYDHIVTVAGSERDGSLNPYSHYGATTVDLAAPGVDLCSLDIDSDTDTAVAAGTSYATPLVAGVAALLFSTWPELTPSEAARVLRASVTESADLAGKVASGGIVSASRALQVAVPRLNEPPEVVVNGRATLGLFLGNPAAAGRGTLVLTHSALFAVGDVPGWAVTPFSPGDSLDLPDGRWTATLYGTVMEGDLPAGSQFTLPVEILGSRVEREYVSVRLVTDGGLGSPWKQGTDDATGQPALWFTVDVRAVAGPDTGDSGEAPLDTQGAADDTGDAVSGSCPEPKCDGGCGCQEGTAGMGLAGWLAVALVGRRRRMGVGASRRGRG